MKRSTRGCGCAIAVLVLLLGAGGFGFWKYGLPWLRSRPPKPTGELQVHVLDVGPIEGDSILIISPAGKSVLIDAGDAGKGKVVLDALKRYKVERLDYFIATHPHTDHIGAADEVLNGIKVANVIDNGVDLSTPAPVTKPGKGKKVAAPPPPPKKSKTKTANGFFDEYRDALKQNGAQYEKAEPGKKYDLGGGAILTVLAPAEPFFTKDQMKAGGNEINANSIVLRLDYGDFSMLFMGDAESQTEERLLSKSDLDLKVKVIKIGHHGSKYATSENFVKRVQPEAAIISDGGWNRYGHPAQSVLDRLKAANAKVWRTDLQGEVTITTKGRGDAGKLFEIKTAKETKEDLWAGREGMKDDSSRSGFIAYGDFGAPPKPKTEKPKKK
ncbi:MAG: competence protein ComEC [Blastocatellia bacterium]|jgi:beta-lactamase superfamily II metal-dependent hydrolase|nr:competence protein ComEC [Blastocatellia bacterium]